MGGQQASGGPDPCLPPVSRVEVTVVPCKGFLPRIRAVPNRQLSFSFVIRILNDMVKYPPTTLESLEKESIMFGVIFLLSRFHFLRAIISGTYMVI